MGFCAFPKTSRQSGISGLRGQTFDQPYGFRRNRGACESGLRALLRIQQQIIYPPPRSNSSWSPVFAPTSAASFDAFGVFGSADDVVSHSRQVTNSSAPDQHDRVFLQIVPFSRNVGRHLHVVGKANACDFSKRRVRLFGCNGSNLQTDARFLRCAFLEFTSPARKRISYRPQRRCFRLFAGPLARVSYKLVQRGQRNLRFRAGNNPSVCRFARQSEPLACRNR